MAHKWYFLVAILILLLLITFSAGCLCSINPSCIDRCQCYYQDCVSDPDRCVDAKTGAYTECGWYNAEHDWISNRNAISGTTGCSDRYYRCRLGCEDPRY